VVFLRFGNITEIDGCHRKPPTISLELTAAIEGCARNSAAGGIVTDSDT